MAKDILSSLKPATGSRRKPKRIGRGQGSGTGGTSTKGHKGAHSRAGAGFPAWFEGGQMPLVRRVPKRGFHSPFRVAYQIVNLGTLAELAVKGRISGGVVNPETLAKLGVVHGTNAPVKILGNGDLTVKLDVHAHAFSASAAAKIQAAGGTTTTISRTATSNG